MAEMIIPISFSRVLNNEEIEAFMNELKDFADIAKVGCQIIPAELAHERVQAMRLKREQANENIPLVSGSALTDGDKMHYEHLQECCNKILDAVESGKVPQREIMGLKLLMNR